MKIIFLNIWHNTRSAELAAFITHQAPTTDIFCFEEADPAARQSLRQLLSDFTEYSHDKPDIRGDWFGQATYVKDTASVIQRSTLLEDAPDTGIVLIMTIQQGDSRLTVANVHGISYDADTKLDTEGRLVQSKTIIESLQDIQYPIIIGGDFNLEPTAESIRMFAEAGYRDLIASHHIKTTRNRLVWERYPDTIQYYADYTFTSPDVHIRSFMVPENEISDHLPLILECDLLNVNHQPAPIISASLEM